MDLLSINITERGPPKDYSYHVLSKIQIVVKEKISLKEIVDEGHRPSEKMQKEMCDGSDTFKCWPSLIHYVVTCHYILQKPKQTLTLYDK